MCEGLQDLFFYCNDWAFNNVFLNIKKNNCKKRKENKKTNVRTICGFLPQTYYAEWHCLA